MRSQSINIIRSHRGALDVIQLYLVYIAPDRPDDTAIQYCCAKRRKLAENHNFVDAEKINGRILGQASEMA